MADITQNPLLLLGLLLALLFLASRQEIAQISFTEKIANRIKATAKLLKTDEVSRVLLPNEKKQFKDGFTSFWMNRNLVLYFEDKDTLFEIDRDALREVLPGVWEVSPESVMLSQGNGFFHYTIPQFEERTGRDGKKYTVELTHRSTYDFFLTTEAEKARYDFAFKQLEKSHDARPEVYMEHERHEQEQKRREGILKGS